MKKINISFAITACNEAYELSRLLSQLDECMIDGDQITVQLDQSKLDDETLKVVSDYMPSKKVDGQKTFVSLDGNFADFKNSIKKHCTKEYIFFIDADEEVNVEQITLLREILSLNPTIDVFLIPRINTVEGLTQAHIDKWRWNISKLESQIGEKELNLNNPQDLDEYNLLKKYNLIIEENEIS